ncbi:hypothetical protein D3C85_1279070 [compost metagenome]
MCGALGNPPDAVQVGREHLLPVVFADLQSALATANTGVVEYHVDHAERRLGCIEGRLDASAVGDIQSHRERLAAFALDVLGDLAETLQAPRRQHHAGTSACGHASKVCTDTAGGAGNQHSFTG